MSTFAIGDIHGNEPALSDLLAQLQPLVQPVDTVVFLGDYIDRGPCSRQCIARILEFREACPGTVVALLGNHEFTLLETHGDFTAHSWLIAMDAWPTIESYSAKAAERLRAEAKQAGGRLYSAGHRLPYEVFFDAMPDEHLEFFQNLTPYYRTPDVLCVHAGIEPGRGAIESQAERVMIWGSYRFPEKYLGPELIAYGHYGNAVLDDDGWPQPVMLEHSIGVDTSKHGVVTAVQLPGRRILQSARYTVRSS